MDTSTTDSETTHIPGGGGPAWLEDEAWSATFSEVVSFLLNCSSGV